MHVLVHYLFTDTYQCLQPKGTAKYDRLKAEFVTAVRTYALSRKYEMPFLENLTKGEMQRLSNELPFAVVVDLLQDTYPVTDEEDSWLSAFFEKRLILLLDPSETERETSSMSCKTLSISELLLKSLRRLSEHQRLRVHDPDTALNARVTEDLTFRMPVPQFGLPEGPKVPPSDTELSCGLELTEIELSEHEPELGHGSPTFGSDAGPVEPQAELVEHEAELTAQTVEFETETTLFTNKAKKKAKKAQKAAEEKFALHSVKAMEPDDAPVAADEWSVCGSEAKMIDRN